MVDNDSKTALVTGARSGIGRACVSALADRGWHVLATVRDIETAKDLAFESTSIDIHQLDLTDSAGLPSQVADILSRCGRLDALINNAGIA